MGGGEGEEGGGGQAWNWGEQLGNLDVKIQLWILPYKPGRRSTPAFR